MRDKINGLIKRYQELETLMSASDFTSDQKRMETIAREYTDLHKKMPLFKAYVDTLQTLEESEEILKSSSDSELHELAREELQNAQAKREEIEKDVQILLIPRHPSDHKNALLEIRAGAGGSEAGLFAADLYRMYQYYAESQNWTMEVLSSSFGEMDALKEIIVLVKGDNVYGTLKYESGVHRVQRVPKTETQGRIHTSAASVAILPESDDVEVTIDDNDLRMDFFRAGGAGGQHVNKTDSAVRIVHIPSGITVSCQDEKSQHKNKAKALKILQSRLLDFEIQKKQQAESSARKLLVGSGDRSAKIRTYNFPQGRVTDHRINLTLYKLEAVMVGNIHEFSMALAHADIQEQISNS